MLHNNWKQNFHIQNSKIPNKKIHACYCQYLPLCLCNTHTHIFPIIGALPCLQVTNRPGLLIYLLIYLHACCNSRQPRIGKSSTLILYIQHMEILTKASAIAQVYSMFLNTFVCIKHIHLWRRQTLNRYILLPSKSGITVSRM